MLLTCLLATSILFPSIILAGPDVYFRTLLPQKIYIFGKALHEVESNGNLKVTFDYLYMDFEHQMKLSLEAASKDGKERAKQR